MIVKIVFPLCKGLDDTPPPPPSLPSQALDPALVSLLNFSLAVAVIQEPVIVYKTRIFLSYQVLVIDRKLLYMVICSTSDIDNYCKYLSKAHTNCQLISNSFDQYQIQTKEHLEYTCIYSINLLKIILERQLVTIYCLNIVMEKARRTKTVGQGSERANQNFSDAHDGDDIKTSHHQKKSLINLSTFIMCQ